MISIIICTHNRSELLEICLSSVLNGLENVDSNFEIVVVDNNSFDNTKDIVESMNSSKFQYFFLDEIGLSKARNYGFLKSKGDWIVYLDDDCYVNNDFFAELTNTIKNYHFDAFTGNYLPWYRAAKPRWISEEFGRKKVQAKETMPLDYPDYFTGGIMAFKKNKLRMIGLFPTNFGMKGNQVAYGEESFVVKKLQENGCKLGINPNWIIYHLVRKEKLTLKWQFVSRYAQGRDGYRISGEDPLLKLIFQPLFVLIKRFGPKTKLLLIKSDYYWQNYLIDLGEYFAINAGKIKGWLMTRSS